jgi:outer membrane protein assembly factor BamB
VCLFNKDGKLLWRYEVYDGPYSVSVSADGSYVTAGSDGKVYFFNRAGKLLWSYQHPEQRERYLFSIDVDAELEDDLKKGIFTERLENIFKTKGLPLDENIISAIKNNWDIGGYSIQKEKGKIDFYRRYSCMYIYYTWISSDGNYVAAKTRGKLYFFNKYGELLWSFQTEGDPGSIWRGVSISSDGSYVVVGNYGDDHHYDGNLYFFNRNGELLGEYKTNTSVESASISSDGSYVAVGTFNMVYCFVGSTRGYIPHMIKKAQSSIESAKNFGAGTVESEKRLQHANSALNVEKYEDAKHYAGQAKESAEKAETRGWILYGIVILLYCIAIYWLFDNRA